MEKNNWRTATFILLPIILGLIIVGSAMKNNKQLVKFPLEEGELTITTGEFNQIKELMKDEQTFKICNMEEGTCVRLQRLPE